MNSYHLRINNAAQGWNGLSYWKTSFAIECMEQGQKKFISKFGWDPQLHKYP